VIRPHRAASVKIEAIARLLAPGAGGAAQGVDEGDHEERNRNRPTRIGNHSLPSRFGPARMLQALYVEDKVMKHAILLYATGALWLAQSALAQNSAATQPSQSAPTTSAATPQTRPDAKYPNPSGQDSQPSQTAPKKSNRTGNTNGTVEPRGSKTKDQSAASQGVAKQKSYTGNSGKKSDPGTACSSARPTANGGVDCGVGGNAATTGRIPK
jgi:hypothetical protein